MVRSVGAGATQHAARRSPETWTGQGQGLDKERRSRTGDEAARLHSPRPLRSVITRISGSADLLSVCGISSRWLLFALGGAQQKRLWIVAFCAGEM